MLIAPGFSTTLHNYTRVFGTVDFVLELLATTLMIYEHQYRRRSIYI